MILLLIVLIILMIIILILKITNTNILARRPGELNGHDLANIIWAAATLPEADIIYLYIYI